MSLGRLVAHVASIGVNTRPDILANLTKESEWLEQQTDQFKYIADQFEIKFCYETLPMRVLGRSNLVSLADR